MPNGNINSDALDSLFDPNGNVVLEQFEDSAYGTTAVLLRPESAAYRAQTGLGDPYVVAYGYDKETTVLEAGIKTSKEGLTMSYGFKEIMRQIDDARKVQDMSRDPFGSHDGMDIDPHTAVVETCGYGYRNEVCDDVREAFRQDIEDEQQINELKRENYEQEAR